jgi:hypothetical protein
MPASRAPRVAPERRLAPVRAAVLRAGDHLGWRPGEVIALAEALAQRPWRRCGWEDLTAVLDEYLALLEVVAARRRGGLRAPRP